MPGQPQFDQVWERLDRPALRAVVEQGPPPVFATISGAHLYGFASRDSDVDVRGAFVLPARKLLGLSKPEETYQVDSTVSDIELDFVAHDVRKFALMLTRHNGYALEQLLSPLVLVSGPDHEELCHLAEGCVTRALFRHYRGFAHGRRKILAAPGATVKDLLYAYRVYLSGIHALRTGRIEANLPVLNDEFRIPAIADLIERKRNGVEKQIVEDGEVDRHKTQFDRLEEELERAHTESSLPDDPTTLSELEDFVVRVRLRSLEA
jgi:predicted nucleotidyltransferase